MDGAPAGWRPDPTGHHTHRYWDGDRWTDQVADRGARSVDPYVEPAPVPEPASAPAPEPDAEPGFALSGWGNPLPPTPLPPIPPPQPDDAPARTAGARIGRRVRAPKGWVLVGVGAVLAVVAVVALLANRGDDGDGTDTTASKDTTSTSLDLTSRTTRPADAPTGSDGGPLVAPPPAGLTPEDLKTGLGLTDEQATCFSQQLALAQSRGDDTTDAQLLLQMLRGCGADPSDFESR